MQRLLIFKIVALCGTLIAAFIGAVISRYFRTSDRALSLANTFSAGIFLGAGLLHLLGDATDGLQEWADAINYPVAPGFMVLGFLFTLLLERVFLNGHDAIISSISSDGQSISSQTSSESQYLLAVKNPEYKTLSKQLGHGSVNTSEDSGQFEIPTHTHHHHHHAEQRKCHSDSDATKPLICVPDLDQCNPSHKHLHTLHIHSEAYGLGVKVGLDLAEHMQHSGHPPKTTISEQPEARLVPFLLLIVLGVHSLLAGIAVGTEQDTLSIIGVAVALMFHKLCAAIALGVNFVKASLSLKMYWGLIACFAIITPTGIGAGLLISHEVDSISTLDKVAGVFSGIAAGTFLYISTVVIMEAEFATCTDKYPKFLLLLLGLGAMAVLAIWT